MERSPDFLHGTSSLAAIGIWLDGFRLMPVHTRFWGRGALGHGIYLTRSLEWAIEFTRDFANTGSGVVVRVELGPGSRLLWLDGNFDPNTIESLRREFGAEVLRPDFHKAIPANKHLRTRELIDLLNYLHARKSGAGFLWKVGWAGVSGVRSQLRRAKYSGFGCATDDLGIVAFDPANLVARSFERVTSSGALEPAQPEWLLANSVLRLRELRSDVDEIMRDPNFEGFSAAEISEVRRELRAALAQVERFAGRYGLELPELG
ncbi:MAG: hypothetical protein KDB80_06155 [Planctomycetes bacterium]|nr:hypothetical protein [Planctomycetota bacterium]